MTIANKVKFLQGDDFPHLEELVNEHLDKGWQLHGDWKVVVTEGHTQYRGTTYTKYVQAVYKYSESVNAE